METRPRDDDNDDDDDEGDERAPGHFFFHGDVDVGAETTGEDAEGGCCRLASSSASHCRISGCCTVVSAPRKNSERSKPCAAHPQTTRHDTTRNNQHVPTPSMV
jgi:hypothetical protein